MDSEWGISGLFFVGIQVFFCISPTNIQPHRFNIKPALFEIKSGLNVLQAWHVAVRLQYVSKLLIRLCFFSFVLIVLCGYEL